MGLDQYLSGKIYIYSNYSGSQTKKELADYKKIGKILESCGVKPDGSFCYSIGFDIGSWRKANAIHNWFVENVQSGNDDCGEHFVPREKLKELAELCLKVLKNPKESQDVLPTADGFFFGSTEYDEWYARELVHTLQLIYKALTLPDEVEIFYSSSW